MTRGLPTRIGQGRLGQRRAGRQENLRSGGAGPGRGHAGLAQAARSWLRLSIDVIRRARSLRAVLGERLWLMADPGVGAGTVVMLSLECCPDPSHGQGCLSPRLVPEAFQTRTLARRAARIPSAGPLTVARTDSGLGQQGRPPRPKSRRWNTRAGAAMGNFGILVLVRAEAPFRELFLTNLSQKTPSGTPAAAGGEYRTRGGTPLAVWAAATSRAARRRSCPPGGSGRCGDRLGAAAGPLSAGAGLGLEPPGTWDGVWLVLAIVVALKETWTPAAGGSRPDCVRQHTVVLRRRRPGRPGAGRARDGENRRSRDRARRVSPRP